MLVTQEVNGELRDMHRRLGRLGDALGAVRDDDVLDGYLQKYVAGPMPGAFSEAPASGYHYTNAPRLRGRSNYDESACYNNLAVI